MNADGKSTPQLSSAASTSSSVAPKVRKKARDSCVGSERDVEERPKKRRRLEKTRVSETSDTPTSGKKKKKRSNAPIQADSDSEELPEHPVWNGRSQKSEKRDGKRKQKGAAEGSSRARPLPSEVIDLEDSEDERERERQLKIIRARPKTKSKPTNPADVIDLCSDDEPPPPRLRPKNFTPASANAQIIEIIDSDDDDEPSKPVTRLATPPPMTVGEDIMHLDEPQGPDTDPASVVDQDGPSVDDLAVIPSITSPTAASTEKVHTDVDYPEVTADEVQPMLDIRPRSPSPMDFALSPPFVEPNDAQTTREPPIGSVNIDAEVSTTQATHTDAKSEPVEEGGNSTETVLDATSGSSTVDGSLFQTPAAPGPTTLPDAPNDDPKTTSNASPQEPFPQTTTHNVANADHAPKSSVTEASLAENQPPPSQRPLGGVVLRLWDATGRSRIDAGREFDEAMADLARIQTPVSTSATMSDDEDPAQEFDKVMAEIEGTEVTVSKATTRASWPDMRSSPPPSQQSHLAQQVAEVHKNMAVDRPEPVTQTFGVVSPGGPSVALPSTQSLGPDYRAQTLTPSLSAESTPALSVSRSLSTPVSATPPAVTPSIGDGFKLQVWSGDQPPPGWNGETVTRRYAWAFKRRPESSLGTTNAAVTTSVSKEVGLSSSSSPGTIPLDVTPLAGRSGADMIPSAAEVEAKSAIKDIVMADDDDELEDFGDLAYPEASQ
ncbi:hypothetical protein C8F01DRAFT_309850 [Mycena amicta]|nr:hypothetical protein C8F01DRAFT_309850 [Mycena amicta]